MLNALIRIVFFGVGLFILYLLIQKFGVFDLIQAFRGIGWKVVYVLVLPPFWFLLQTRAWQLTVEETGTVSRENHVTFFQLFRIKISGDAFNTLTPLGFIGGDPVRFALLRQRMPGALSAASIVLDRTMQILAVVTILVASLILASFFLKLPPSWKIVFPIVTMIMAFFIWVAIHHQRKGVFERLFLKLHQLGIKRKKIETLLDHLRETDSQISHFYRYHPRRFFAVFTYHLIGRFIGVLEIALVAYLLGIPLPLVGAFFLATLAILVNLLFTFIPGSMGVLEGAYGALCVVMGLSPLAGVAIQLVRRLRAVFWITVGIWLATWKT